MKAPFFFGWRNTPATSRWLRVADAASCARLHRTSFAHPWSVPEFEALLNDPACVADGVEIKSSLAGFVLSRRAADEAEVLTIVVAPGSRRNGHGQRLLGAHLARLAGLRVKNLFLEVDEANAAALALYRRFGFTVEGRRKSYYAKAEGKAGDALIMRRALA
ncbi:ribosomal protein S18-alanine N-acetyltransferase [Rhodoblastus sp.]|uniref:ribosomal protein S18-alanine N-acetyltransferase n=1 Tax=Rhodoblastus sp. TaxID=1962975 RepID=UPI002638C219|nr:ribosomal protein S18-alanine N-acetyltransferase [Rhodoblastus sp.]